MSDRGEAPWRIAVIEWGAGWIGLARSNKRTIGPVGGATATKTLDALTAQLPTGATVRDVRFATDTAERAIATAPAPRAVLFTTDRPDMPDGAADATSFTIPPERTVRVRERVLADGTVTDIPQIEEFGPALEAAVADGFEACAIRFAHAPAYPIHEQLVFGHAHRAGFTSVSASYECAPDATFPERAELTILDVALRLTAMPSITIFAVAVRDQLGSVPIRIASADGLVDLEALQPIQLRGSLAAVETTAAEDEVTLLEALASMPLHAVRTHAVRGDISAAAANMIVARLRYECFADLIARGADRGSLAWMATADTSDGEQDITAPDARARVVNAGVRLITVEAIEDA